MQRYIIILLSRHKDGTCYSAFRVPAGPASHAGGHVHSRYCHKMVQVATLLLRETSCQVSQPHELLPNVSFTAPDHEDE